MALLAKDVVNALIKDFESFYYNSAKFKIRKEFDSSSRLLASCVGVAERKRIRFSKDFCDFEVKTTDDLFFVAIIVCHEIAHYLNSHSEHKDQESIDFTAFEIWADYFGARIFISSITFGSKMQMLIKRFNSVIDQDKIISSIGRAILDMYESIYLPTTDKKYPSAIERVLIFNAGSTSFFYRLYGELTPQFSTKFILTILKESGLTNKASEYHRSPDEELKIQKKIIDMHKTLQGNDASITKGLKPEYYPFLTTNYIQSPQETKDNREKLYKQISDLGFNAEEIMAGNR